MNWIFNRKIQQNRTNSNDYKTLVEQLLAVYVPEDTVLKLKEISESANTPIEAVFVSAVNKGAFL